MSVHCQYLLIILSSNYATLPLILFLPTTQWLKICIHNGFRRENDNLVANDFDSSVVAAVEVFHGGEFPMVEVVEVNELKPFVVPDFLL
jgi:hypothetical protein